MPPRHLVPYRGSSARNLWLAEPLAKLRLSCTVVAPRCPFLCFASALFPSVLLHPSCVSHLRRCCTIRTQEVPHVS
jgi:hypothetical protein